MSKKIGLITIWHVPNFGSVLQTYATQEIIKKLGFECVLLNYKYPNQWHYSQGRKPKSLRSVIGYILGLSPYHRKSKKLNKFKNRFFNFSSSFTSLDEMISYDWSDYRTIAVGSDQVWNYRYTFADSAFMLSFLPEDIRRISIASSFASQSLPLELRLKYKKYLSLFDAISVREQNALSIVNDELGLKQNAAIILDPTLLLSRDEWMSLIPRSKFVKKRRYILLYMLTYAFEPRPYIFDVLKYMSVKYEYDIVALEGYTRSENAKGVTMIDKTDSDISEFIDLFANADMVVTSSFHGTAFAVNFGIPLISIVPNDRSDDRQSSLLKALGANQSLVNLDQSIAEINPYYDATSVKDRLTHMRSQSLTWINNTL